MSFFKTKHVSAGTQVEIELPVAFIEEGDTVIAYTPALDLSTSGSSRTEALKMFSEVVRIFFDDLMENNTADEVLPALGWTKADVKSSWQPPKISQESVGVKMPVFA